MVAVRKIRCVVVVVPAEVDGMIHHDTPEASQPRFRPSDLLPWSDPYIRSLVEQLQEEVRSEAAEARATRTRIEELPTSDRWDAFEVESVEGLLLD